MIGTMTPTTIPGCGEPDPGLADELRAITAAAVAWANGDEAEEEALGQRTPEKLWLIACLCKTLATQLRNHDGGQPLPQPRQASEASTQ